MAENESDLSMFRYESEDFLYTINKNDTKDSRFDSILKEKWTNAEKNGILRYKLNIREWKILEGSFRFLAQLNLDRAANRRKPEDITSMSQPFDPNRFNFTKLPNKEIFFDIGDGSGNDVIAANVSPLEWGHSLFLPDRLKCFPQQMNESCLLKAMELILLSNSIFLRVVFNSLCAHASVNHLHMHLYYLKHQMLLEDIKLEQLQGPLFILTKYPSKGFCFKLSSFLDRNIKKFASLAFIVIKHLQENNIAHNIYITRSRTDCETEIYDDIRIYIWARKPSSGVKDTRAFVPATCEFFGHLSIRCEEEYRNLTEEKVVRVLENVTAEIFNSVKKDLKHAIEIRTNSVAIKQT